MTTTHRSITFLRTTPESAYDYLTRPAHWRDWHHASLGTEAHAASPMRAGDRFREQIRTVGIRKELNWHVVHSDAPGIWEAQATMADGSTARLHYAFEAAEGGTRFTRTLSYTLKPWSLRLLNGTIGWLKVRLESKQALRRLQRHFE